MPRPLRLDFPGARHHVMNRGARRAPIFVDDATCTLFLSVVADLPARFDVRVHGYALMPNHYHLLLEAPRGNVSRAMQYVGSEYVRRLNEHGAWDGPLFRGRFRNRLVETDAYWLHLLLYLHLNPLRAHLVADIDSSYWTSHAAYTGASRRPDWLTTADQLDGHGGVEGYRQALDDLHTGRRPAPADFDPDRLWRPATSDATPPPPRFDAAVDVDAALVRVATICAVEPQRLRTSLAGRADNRPRWVAAWWLTAGLGLTQRAAARALVVSEEQVSRWLARVPALAVDDAEVGRWLAELRGVVAVG
ncbi:MAG: transposase [Pseudomonadota bacterium]|nr:transposase [Pseudomonadota bacterium]